MIKLDTYSESTTPAIAALIRLANTPAQIALKPYCEMKERRSGTKLPKPPIRIAMVEMLANHTVRR